MRWIREHRPTPGTILGLAALVVALGGAAFAAIPDSGGTIHACYQKNNGNLRVVESDAECRNSENTLAWDQGAQNGAAARAFGRVLSDGTLDAARSSNVGGVAQSSSQHFVYCLNLNFTPVNIVATAEAGPFEPSRRQMAASVDPALVSSLCPEGFRSALVDVVDASGFKGFYVVIR